MKKIKATALVILAAATAAVSLSGCQIIIGGQPVTSTPYSSTVEDPPTSPVTEAPTTVEITTEAPTTEEPSTEAPKPKYSTESNGSAVLLDNEKYHDSYLGITFTLPDWVGKVYAQSTKNDGHYSLGFYEKTNYDWGEKKSWPGMGMLFTVSVSDKETTKADIIYPAGSELIAEKVTYLNYFKPTDVRFNSDDQKMTSVYRSAANHQRDYFTSGVVDADKYYVPSPAKYAMNLTSE